LLTLFSIFSAFGLAASAGLNAYIPLLAVALLGKFTNLITLNTPWDALTNWWVIGLLIVLVIIEFVEDKIPVVNHINDIIQTFIRPVAGAIAFAASTSVIKDMDPVLALVIGLFIAGGVHTVKSAIVRPIVSATTAGTGNIPVSIGEDAISTTVSLVSIILPWLGILLSIILITLAIVFIQKIVERKKRKALEKQAAKEARLKKITKK
jgi:hypothetical protein